MDQQEIYRRTIVQHFGRVLVEEHKTAEIKTLQQIANGMSKRDAADALGVSVATVNRHLRRLRALLGAPNDVNLVAKAVDLRLIDVSGLGDV